MNANDKLGAYVLLAMHGYKKEEIKWKKLNQL